jgi:putative membrane protein
MRCSGYYLATETALEHRTMNRKTSTLLSIGISAALVAGAIWFLLNHHNNMWASGYWQQMPHGRGMMIGGAGMGFLMILFWAVVVIALVMLITAIFSGRRASSPTRSALEILQERYARGEIDKRRFDAMRRDLEQREVEK